MHIDTNKRTVIYNSTSAFLIGFTFAIVMDFSLLLISYKEFSEGNIYSEDGITALAFLILFLGLTLVCIYGAVTFSKAPRIELSPLGMTYGLQRTFIPWHAITRFQVCSIEPSSFRKGRSNHIVLDVDDLSHIEDFGALRGALHAPSKALGFGAFDVSLFGCRIPPAQIEQMIHAYAKAHGAPGAEDWN